LEAYSSLLEEKKKLEEQVSDLEKDLIAVSEQSSKAGRESDVKHATEVNDLKKAIQSSAKEIVSVKDSLEKAVKREAELEKEVENLRDSLQDLRATHEEELSELEAKQVEVVRQLNLRHKKEVIDLKKEHNRTLLESDNMAKVEMEAAHESEKNRLNAELRKLQGIVDQQGSLDIDIDKLNARLKSIQKDTAGKLKKGQTPLS
jgi:chromosome segregation ATPase